MIDETIVSLLYRWVSTGAFFTPTTVLLAQDGIIVLPVALALLWFDPRSDVVERHKVFLVSFLALVLALVLIGVLSLLFDRPRPFVALGVPPHFPHDTDSSFPSDHALVGVAMVGPLLWCRPRLGIGLMPWALVVGFARVASAVHYPSDILGSAALAVVPVVIGLRFTPLLLSRLPLARWLLTVGAS